ncbi:MAG: hypothetical protein IPK04_01220 [Bdellovibrionales bacterium]|nr:hypothetical protein [Bdellovibrionales bacterium]
MKTIITVLFLVFAQLSLAQGSSEKKEIIDIPVQHPETKYFSGAYNYQDFMKLTCALQLEEILDIVEKFGWTAGAQTSMSINLEQKRYTPEAHELMVESVKVFEAHRRIIWDERSHKEFLFGLNCHAHKNPDRNTVNPADPKKPAIID